jgi:anthranilate 1,2-dioxygenase small subunit
MAYFEPATQDMRQGIHELIAAYAECIDEDRLEEWPDFFVEDCRYLITSRQSHEAGYRHGVVYAASNGMLVDRILALRRANIFEPHRNRHIVGPIRVGKVEGGTAQVRSNFIAVRIMHDGEMSLSPPAAISTRSTSRPSPIVSSSAWSSPTAKKSTPCW